MVDPRRKKRNCDTAQRTLRTLSTVSLLVFATGQSATWRTAAARKITVIWSTRPTSGVQSSMVNLTQTPDWQRAKRSIAMLSLLLVHNLHNFLAIKPFIRKK